MGLLRCGAPQSTASLPPTHLLNTGEPAGTIGSGGDAESGGAAGGGEESP